MNHTTFNKTFINTRQQASAAALALSLTLGMLLSVNLLATQPAAVAQMSAASASGAQASQRIARAPQV